MKTNFTFLKILLAIFYIAVLALSSGAQISFEGLFDEGQGGAGWDADGSGPEPYGNGHAGVYYYLASNDYIDPSFTGGAHLLGGMDGFPLFEQALVDNGYTADQVMLQVGLHSLGEDIMGEDWFTIESTEYGNWGPFSVHLKLDDEMMIYGTTNYNLCYNGPETGGEWFMENAFFVVENVSAFSSQGVKNVAQAFMDDMEGLEMRMIAETEFAQQILTGNGRYGAYLNVTGTLEKGLPNLPFLGLLADDEGTAAWDADGTGPEPYGDGHQSLLYYAASVDYGGINPGPDACLGHFLDGSAGFMNTLLQMQYRGFEIGDLKVKMGLCSLGPDIMGEDWGIENGKSWLNEYNNNFTFEVNGEPILLVLMDTSKMVLYDPVHAIWSTNASAGKVYDISENASEEVQYVAQSFLRDLGTHYLKAAVTSLSYAGSFNGNGRSGAFYEILSGDFTGLNSQATFIQEGPVDGLWTLANSPYYIEGPLTVEDGMSLTIEPGVKVAVRGPYPITVNGSVTAIGTEEANITFIHSNPNVWWDGFDYDGVPDSSEVSVFDHCYFRGGLAQGGGDHSSGGIFAIRDNDLVHILNSTFTNNRADLDDPSYYTCGGAIGLWNASPEIQKCIFHDNISQDFGGAILVYMGSAPVISNCLFYDNYSEYGGAISYHTDGQGILINNTFSDNEAIYGGGLYISYGSNPEIINNIIYGNAATNGNQCYISSFPVNNPGFYYNDIEGGQEGIWGGASVEYLFNIDENPQFLGDTEYMYAIEEISPCKDMGTPDTSVWYMPEYLPEYCLMGNERIYNGRVDIGACEWVPGVGINEPFISDQMLLIAYPNPVMDVLNVGFLLEKPETASMAIYNNLGALVEVHELGKMKTGNNVITWNSKGLPEGIYYCRIRIGNQIATKKIVKTR